MARQTPLHPLHLRLGGRMVEFAGWQLPVQFPAGIIKEHLHTRRQASLFDVSHMGQLWLDGEQADTLLEKLSPSDLTGLARGRQRYTLLLNHSGGTEDDCIVARVGNGLWMVVNAARLQHDTALVQRALGQGAGVTRLQDRALLALQGPAAEAVLSRHCPPVAAMSFMDVIEAPIADADCWIARSGYTGEDGYEVSCPSGRAQQIAQLLLAAPEVLPAGLGARDSLRLEAGLCLYGQELSPQITPVQAKLSWVIAKDRRPDGPRPGGFAGADVIFQQMQDGPQHKRVGLAVSGRVPVRSGAMLFADKASALSGDNALGQVTSGGFAPSLGEPCAMGYVPAHLAKTGQPLYAAVRGKALALKVTAPNRIKRSG